MPNNDRDKNACISIIQIYQNIVRLKIVFDSCVITTKRGCPPLPAGSLHPQGYKDEASVNLYWQLYKSLAAYRMALREEKRRGGEFTYDWIVRARFDVAWVRPLPPLRSFSRDAVWFGALYWYVRERFDFALADDETDFTARVIYIYNTRMDSDINMKQGLYCRPDWASICFG